MGVHFSDGFDRPETIAFGLGAPQLAMVAIGTLVDYVVLHTSAPAPLRYVVGALIALLVALLAWGRYLERPLLSWAWLGIRYFATPRAGGGIAMPTDETRAGQGDVTSHGVVESAAGLVARAEEHSQPGEAPAVDAVHEPPWAKWLRERRAQPPATSEPTQGSYGEALNQAPNDGDDTGDACERSDAEASSVSPPEPQGHAATAPVTGLVRGWLTRRQAANIEPHHQASSSESPSPDPESGSFGVSERNAEDVEAPRAPIVLLPEPPQARATVTARQTESRGERSIPDTTVIPLSAAFRDDSDGHTRVEPASGLPARAHIDDSTAPVFVGATRRIAFFSLGGGNGRTTLASEIACLLAARGRYRLAPDSPPAQLQVALLDLDLRSSSMAIRLGVPHPTLLDYLVAADDDPALMGRYMISHPSGLRALLGPPKPLSTTTLEPAKVAEIIHQLEREGTHFIVCDVGSDLGAITTYVLTAVHDIYVVIRPSATGIQDAYRTTEALRRLGLGAKLRYVVNRTRGPVDLDEVMGDLGGRVVATIPDDSRIEAAENTHRQVSLDGGGAAADAIAHLAAQIYPSLGTRRVRSRFSLFGRRRVG